MSPKQTISGAAYVTDLPHLPFPLRRLQRIRAEPRQDSRADFADHGRSEETARGEGVRRLSVVGAADCGQPLVHVQPAFPR